MIARWREDGKEWREGAKDKVERVGMIAAEREKGGMNGQRGREWEQWRINQYVQLHSAFLKSYFSIRHHLRGEESSRKGQRGVEGWAVQPDQHQARFRRPGPTAPSVARTAGGGWCRPAPDRCDDGGPGGMCSLCIVPAGQGGRRGGSLNAH